MAANSRIAVRYAATAARTISLRCLAEKPRSRPATTRLAARRLTSHSHGPGQRLVEVVDVEHRCFRSGVPKIAEVQEVGVAAELDVITRSAASRRGRTAMISAAPR